MFKTNFDTIFCPPVNSSGDIYHIAAYLILCRALNKKVPQVVIISDTDDTEKQVMRCKQFLKALGFIQVYTKRINCEGSRAAGRLKSSKVHVKEYSERAVDQKTTTSLISYAQLFYGQYINEIIAEHILRSCLNRKGIAAYHWANQQVKTAISKLGIHKQRFVILNLRHSSYANSKQNTDNEQLETISKTLAKHGCSLIILDVGSQMGHKFVKENTGQEYAPAIVFDAFPTVDGLHKDYEKFPHLMLLQQLSRLETCLGVIGNTSGTLDIAAFMGLHTLCLHRFIDKSKNNIITPNQDLRILLQVYMMSVFGYTSDQLATERFISTWLTSKQHSLCYKQTQSETITLEPEGFRTKHYQRRCFALDTQGKKANPIFDAQHNQVVYNNKLSEVNSKKIAKAAPPNLIFSSLTATRSKADDSIKKPKPLLKRNSSAPNLIPK